MYSLLLLKGNLLTNSPSSPVNIYLRLTVQANLDTEIHISSASERFGYFHVQGARGLAPRKLTYIVTIRKSRTRLFALC
jgi:hypothetical protein